MKEKLKKIFNIAIKILKWPALYLSVLVIFLYMVPSIIGSVKYERILSDYIVLAVIIILILTFVEGVVSSLFFTDCFLASTGIAAGIYLITSLFIKNRDVDLSSGDFDAAKMIACFALIFFVFLGDLSVFILRKILNRNIQKPKKNIRNKKLAL